MKSVEAIKILHSCDLEGRILFRSRELGTLFGESGDTLRSTIKRLAADGILERVAHDAYLYLLFHPNGCDVLGHIATFLRPGEVTYESLESAASQWGFISQIPLGRISCVTTGAEGLVDTRFGAIEFIHTDDDSNDVKRGILDRMPRNRLPIATEERSCTTSSRGNAAWSLSIGMKWMLIDLEELAGNIASKVNGARLTPVIEKEIVHYEIIRSLGRNDLLRDITFQGGTSLRLCYGSLRYSEDLDFVAGDKFDSLPLDDFSKTLRSDLLKSYDTEVSVREPKVVNDFDGVGMRRWTVSVNTNIARPDLPKQRIKLEIASVPAHTSTIRRVAVNYPELDGMYDNLTIRCQTLEEILADKLISFSATDTHIRHRDLWDIPWIVRAQEIDFSAVAALVAAKHADYRCPASLASMIAVGMQRAHVCYADGSFTGQMQRFLSPAVLNRTHDFDNHCDALNTIVEKCFGRVVTSLGISNDVERARRRLATEISLGSISAAVLPKRTLGLS